jgi:hypothetical protein
MLNRLVVGYACVGQLKDTKVTRRPRQGPLYFLFTPIRKLSALTQRGDSETLREMTLVERPNSGLPRVEPKKTPVVSDHRYQWTRLPDRQLCVT